MNSGTIGKTGEQLFAAIMRSRNYKVEDVSNNTNYFDKDIDFLVTSPTTGAVKTFEVKFDTLINRTGNLYLEIESINSKQWNGDGWWPHCQADYLAYGDYHSRTFYIIPVEELRKRVEELPTRIGRCGYSSTGLLVSLGDIQDLYKTI